MMKWFKEKKAKKEGFQNHLFRKTVYGTIGAICVSLLMMGVIGNLLLKSVPQSDETVMTVVEAKQVSAVLEQQYTEEMVQATAETALFEKSDMSESMKEIENNKMLENSVAALRMERDSSWQRLKDRLDRLDSLATEQELQRYALLQYKEQRLELLLQARGLEHCLVVLEEKQANVIAAEEELTEQYEKIFDLVQRNSEYTMEQIVLVPVKTEGES